MYGREKSDSAVVAKKPANKAGKPAAEWAEPRAGTEGNASQNHMCRAQNRGSVSQGLDRVRQLARQHKKMRFTTLLHHVTVERLSAAFYALKRKAAPGVDGMTWQSYEAGLERNLRDLHRRVHTGSYRALPVLRRYIPKGDGGLRPLGIAALEDKLVQSVMVDVLNAIYEEDFLGFSYGFRPGRNQHDALDALAAAIQWRPVNFTGETFLQTEPPIDPSSLTRWRKCLGEAGVEELLAETIEAAKRAGVIKASSAKRVIVDTTVMQKAIAHPTDSRLLERCREHLVKAAARHGVKLRQNYNREAPHLVRQIGRYAHAKQYKRMKKALRTLRSRVGRVMRDVERQLDSVADTGRIALQELIGRTRRVLSQKQKDKNKLYALHAPEVECLAKGKARTPYEFGVKVSITTTHKEGLVVGMRSMPGNPYDGHTLAEALEQAAILSDVKPEVAIVDRGYKGVAVEGVKIYHPGLRRGITRRLRAMIRRRSAIEPAIGHMKTDGKLDRNWLKGALGDAIHAVLCGAGHNLRMILRKLRIFCALVLFALLSRSTSVVFEA
uniref:IS5 family transposase n=1 Tax=Paraburkholderia nodosa TaxID=392320 RepID=UPI0038996AFA